MKKTSQKKDEDTLLYQNNKLKYIENSKDYTQNENYKGYIGKINLIISIIKKNNSIKIKGNEYNEYKKYKLNSNNMDFTSINEINKQQEFDKKYYNYILKNKILKYLNMKRILIFLFIFIATKLILIFVFKIFYNSKNNRINLIIPISALDFDKISKNIKFFKKFIIGLKNIVFIGDEIIENLIGQNKSKYEVPIIFINEKKLIDVDKIKNLFAKRNKTVSYRAGWYIQQFLKMEYYKICKDKYYLIWDGDTIPIRNINMFNNESKPYFDVKTEYHVPYFITIKKIFPDLEKKNNYSFISEHMLVKTEIMKDLINRINNNTKLTGENWYEKVLNSININDLGDSGFSEYETYGTFTKEYYSKVYEVRRFESLRSITRSIKNYNFNSLSFYIIQNVSKEYDAITFEK